ncbi:MAG: hypothetical protein C0413_04645 [Clostridiales bacterium]|nr:hypothetical protein [Clostridiales bacterium]
MKLRTILLLAGGLVLATALVIAALLIPVKKSGGPAAETLQTETTTQEETAQIESTTQEEPVMEPTITATPEAAQQPTEQTVSTVTFPTTDNLNITADLYWTGDASKPFIILFHQADYSRGEYLEIAPKLNALGYNCLAVDQRSGRSANNVKNETYQLAKDAGLPTGYTDAYPDLEAALSYVVSTYAPEKLIVWGSSYSASLVLILASEYSDEIAAALSFSPGEYFKLNGKTVADYAANIPSRCSSPLLGRRSAIGAGLRIRSRRRAASSSCRRRAGGTVLPRCMTTLRDTRNTGQRWRRFLPR